MTRKERVSVGLLGCLLFVSAVGCKKKVAVAPPPPPPPTEVKQEPPKAPVISQFVAEPSTIERGQSTTLRWTVSNATDVTINQGIGRVASTSGTRTVSPGNTLTYTLVAKGPGGSASDSATVTVTVPPPPVVTQAPPKSLNERLAELEDAYFDYDKSNVREDARAVLTKDADALKNILRDFPGATVVIEGHCDERGSAEYNLGLGERRADAAKEFLGQLGVAPGQLKTVSYGKERPQCTESNESCWQKNRRVHFSAGERQLSED